ncbi:hypothetical protein SAMN02982927_00574 [Sporolactobacillus nakayamae]|uniref:Uncharacterized protein n=1 Tax=Sporolactobacillus nakayamae TaxID=269670 RepID=A0A1I2NX68_9BACL|nr:hypothetical protein SAMN02982927_00574 [Sporolactobacillus nakayamae]
MICFHIQKLTVTLQWKPRYIDRASRVRRNQLIKKAHETILDRQCEHSLFL